MGREDDAEAMELIAQRWRDGGSAETFTYWYCAEPDSSSHKFGWRSAEVATELRQLDATLWERLLCELHCTRAGLGQLTQDLGAIFGLFDTPSADGARLFRLSGDVLKVLVSRRTFW